jgi:hypothetical protein
LLVDQFIDGKRDIELRRMVLERKPSSIDEAVNYAVKSESIMFRTINKDDEFTEEVVINSPTANATSLKNKFILPAVAASPFNSQRRESPTSQSATWYTPQNNQQPLEITCLHCKQEGHLMRECPVRQKTPQRSSLSNREVSFAVNAASANTPSRPATPTNNSAPTSVLNNAVSAEMLARRINGKCKINMKPVKFLVDTGADITSISMRIYEQVVEASHKLSPLRAWNASGDQLKSPGKVNVQIQLGTVACFADVLVVTDLVVDCLLARDVLDSCPVTRELLGQLQEAVEKFSEGMPHEVSKNEGQQEACEMSEKI